MSALHRFPVTILPPGSQAEVAPISAEHIAGLLPDEGIAIAHARSNRQAEFATGRALARRQLHKLGFGPTAVPVGPDRMPLWPPGAVGSISHSSDLCAVAVASTDRILALGIDIEVAEPLEPELWALVGTDDEMALIAAALPAVSHGLAAKVLFSVKEAAFKCWYPEHRTFLNFTDAIVSTQYTGCGSLSVAVGGHPFIQTPQGGVRAVVENGLIFTVAWKLR